MMQSNEQTLLNFTKKNLGIFLTKNTLNKKEIKGYNLQNGLKWKLSKQ